ncbi:hypothetical protein SEVIR_5G391700v4 [Setaria viridis]|uniref:Uncharacterized protein n=1 Tax=Setaria viridis TaxID=4556 RepID=A0A4U6UT50_SETVI|nr:uncharacterized protein LOC117858011 [Setaria viridis]XP_034596853.1 uncharacterized protein LOC117858011 [Setaria viridis]TKW17793.1 hypothetical protein SEVIR_5G391700v2 [Setaria viridis]
MGIQVAAVVTPPPCSSSPSSSSPASPSSSAITTSLRHAAPGVRLARSQSSLAGWSAGLAPRRAGQHAIRRTLSASIDSVGSDGGDDEEFLRRIQELAAGQHPGAGGCGWPASVERSASSVGLPLSLRMLKRRKQQQQQLEQGRRDERLVDRAGESARAAVGRAFASMVLIIRELQSFTLQMREALFYEDLQGVLARVHAEMHASFVWLFQHIFSGTPALMVSLMLLLANFTVYSMGDSVATAATLPPPQAAVAAVEMVDTQQPEQSHSSQQRFDPAALKTFSIGRTASVGGNGDGGGKVRPVAGSTGDGQSDESSYRQSGTVLPQDASQQATPLGAGSEASVSDSMAVEDVQDELVIWKRISDEATRMQASARAEELMDPEILEQLVAPVEAPKLDVEYSAEHAATAQRYEQAVSEEPSNSLLLANFAQFLYQVQGDHDRAEHFFKRAVRAEPADAEAMGRYAAFLWQARNDLAAAEETYQEAIAADPGNAHHAAAYAHFLWNTGGEDTCYPLD